MPMTLAEPWLINSAFTFKQFVSGLREWKRNSLEKSLKRTRMSRKYLTFFFFVKQIKLKKN